MSAAGGKRLGRILVQSGVITQEQLDEAVQRAEDAAARAEAAAAKCEQAFEKGLRK